MNTKSNTTILEKVKQSVWAIVLFFALIATYQTCSTAKKVASLKSKIESLPTKEEVSKQIQIEGLKTSKRMLYDNNAIIRTAVRPDDRMNEYDQEIKKIEATSATK
jgi:hypothetical protein